MATTVHFYTFSKREKSTARPSGNGTSFTCRIKEPCSILEPTIELETNNPTSFNYAKIPDFGNRYYRVGNWVSDHDLWTAKLTVDPLATYKTEILASEQYVLRSASKSNLAIPDIIYPVTTQKTVINTDINNPIGLDSDEDFDYILGLLNHAITPPKINGIQYVKLTPQQMENFTYRMLQEDYFGIDSVLADFGFNIAFLHCIVNPAQYIVESYALPHTTNLFTTNTNVFMFGPWELTEFSQYNSIDKEHALSTAEFSSGNTFVSLPQHPQLTDHGAWVNSAPYTQHVLHAGPFGDIPLTFATSEYTMRIACKVEMDFKGNAELKVIDENQKVLAEKQTNLSLQIPIIATSEKTMKAMGNVGNTVTNGILSMGTSLASFWNDAANAIVDTLPQMNASSGSEGILPIKQNWWIQSKFQYVSGKVTEDGKLAGNHLGLPLCEAYTLSDLNGYCKCGNVDLRLPALDAEIREVVSSMESGFFIED